MKRQKNTNPKNCVHLFKSAFRNENVTENDEVQVAWTRMEKNDIIIKKLRADHLMEQFLR